MSHVLTIYQMAMQKAVRLLDEEQKKETHKHTEWKGKKQKAKKNIKKDYTALKQALKDYEKEPDVSITFVVFNIIIE
jgi:hypothetical protein